MASQEQYSGIAGPMNDRPMADIATDDSGRPEGETILPARERRTYLSCGEDRVSQRGP
jgi:hypothetical protein